MSTSKKSLMKRYCDHPLEIFKDQDLARGYICPLCSQIVFNAFSDKCGHTFCHDCILTQVREQGQCPVSGEALQLQDIKPSLLYINIIENLQVVCVNNGLGCPWSGKCRDLDLHFKKDCQHVEIQCKFEGCDFVTQKRLMNSHFLKCQFRHTKCKYCKQIMPLDELTRHAKKCKNQEMECYLGCGQVISRRRKREHEVNECPFFKVNCEYKQFGCTFVCKRNQMHQHLESEDSFSFHSRLVQNKLAHVADLASIKKNSKNNFVKVFDPRKESLCEFHNLSEMELRSMGSIKSSLKSVVDKERQENSDNDSIKVDFDKQSIRSLGRRSSE